MEKLLDGITKDKFPPEAHREALEDRLMACLVAAANPPPREFRPDIVIGMVWKKETQNGREYIKIKFNSFHTPEGKPLYGKMWPRKQESGKYDLYVGDTDIPCKLVHPLMPPRPYYNVKIDKEDKVIWDRASD